MASPSLARVSRQLITGVDRLHTSNSIQSYDSTQLVDIIDQPKHHTTVKVNSYWCSQRARSKLEANIFRSHRSSAYFINSDAHVASRITNLLPHSSRRPSPEELRGADSIRLMDDHSIDATPYNEWTNQIINKNNQMKRISRRKSSECGGVFGELTLKVQMRGRMFPMTLINMHVKRALVEAARKRRDKEKVVFKPLGRRLLSNGTRDFFAMKSFKSAMKSHFNTSNLGNDGSPRQQNLMHVSTQSPFRDKLFLQEEEDDEQQNSPSHSVNTSKHAPIITQSIHSRHNFISMRSSIVYDLTGNALTNDGHQPSPEQLGRMQEELLTTEEKSKDNMKKQNEVSQLQLSKLFIPLCETDDNQYSPLISSQSCYGSPVNKDTVADQSQLQLGNENIEEPRLDEDSVKLVSPPLLLLRRKGSILKLDEAMSSSVNLTGGGGQSIQVSYENSPPLARLDSSRSINLRFPQPKKSMFDLFRDPKVQEVVQEYFDPGCTTNSVFSPCDPGQRKRAMKQVLITATNLITLQNKVKANNSFYRSYYSLLGKIGTQSDYSLRYLAQIADEVLSTPRGSSREKVIAAPVQKKVFITSTEEDKVKLISDLKTMKLNQSVQKYVQSSQSQFDKILTESVRMSCGLQQNSLQLSERRLKNFQSTAQQRMKQLQAHNSDQEVLQQQSQQQQTNIRQVKDRLPSKSIHNHQANSSNLFWPYYSPQNRPEKTTKFNFGLLQLPPLNLEIKKSNQQTQIMKNHS